MTYEDHAMKFQVLMLKNNIFIEMFQKKKNKSIQTFQLSINSLKKVKMVLSIAL